MEQITFGIVCVILLLLFNAFRICRGELPYKK